MVTGQHPFEYLPRVATQVKAIRDLYGVRHSLADAVGIGTGAVAADNLDLRLLAQPTSEGGSGAIGQEIDGAACLHVDEHGPIGLTPTTGKIVYTQHPHGRRDWRGGSTHQAEQCRATDGECEALGEARTGTSTEGEAKVRHVGALRIGAASMSSSEARKAFGEDGTRASGGATDETTDMKAERHPLSGAGTIGEAAPVPTMDTGRAAATERTARGAAGRVEGEEDTPIIVGESVKAKADKVGEELGETHQ
jgi:hypothetical protein